MDITVVVGGRILYYFYIYHLRSTIILFLLCLTNKSNCQIGYSESPDMPAAINFEHFRRLKAAEPIQVIMN